MTFRPAYALAALLIFAIEVVIALFVRDAFVRPHVGDVLAVMLVYCGARAVLRIGVWTGVLIALGIAFAVELAQLADLLSILGLESNRVARVVLGSSFDTKDLAAYTAGGALILLVEHVRRPARA